MPGDVMPSDTIPHIEPPGSGERRPFIQQTYKSRSRVSNNCGGPTATYTNFATAAALMDGDTATNINCHTDETHCADDFLAAQLSIAVGTKINIVVYGNGITATVWWSADGSLWTKTTDVVTPTTGGAIIPFTSLDPSAMYVALCAANGDFRMTEFELEGTTPLLH